MKIVDKAMSLPLVSSAYTEVTRMTSPYMESTMSKMSPVVETTMSVVTGVKSRVEDKVLPHIPVKIAETVTSVQNVAVDHVASAVEKVRSVETFTCIYPMHAGSSCRWTVLLVVGLISLLTKFHN